jgi:tRNA threonylcarbamoyladenosine biosynthesis protein TsaE
MFSKNIKETEKIAKIFLDKILKNKGRPKGALVVGLSGDLGAGKTTFVQTIAKHLFIKNKIKSPTFLIIKKYPIKKSENYKLLFHLDAYRLKDEKELLYLGWEEIINNKEHLVFIEWPENVIKALPKKYHKIHILHTPKGYREFKIKNI